MEGQVNLNEYQQNLSIHSSKNRKYRIGVISDTHGLLREEVKEILQTCDVILHGGDINKQSILEELQTIAPTYAVRGNNDGKWANQLPETRKLTLYGVPFYMIHNKKRIPENLKDSNIIIYGHSHKYEVCKKESKLWLNPGSCGIQRFRLPLTMALLESDSYKNYFVRKINITSNSARIVNSDISQTDMLELVKKIVRETERGTAISKIAIKCEISEEFAEQVCRLYLTHTGIDANGIINKM